MLKLRMIRAEYGDCFLLEYGTRKDPHFMLIAGGPLTGDGRGDHLLQGLKTAGLLGKGKGARLHVDVLKVPQYESGRGASREFFQTITADRYVISANGKVGNPDLTTLAWIVETAKEDGRKIEIWINNETYLTDEFRKRYDPAVYHYEWKAMQPGEHVVELDLEHSGRVRRRPAAAPRPARIDSVMGRPVVGGQKAAVDSVMGRPVVGGQKAVVDSVEGRPVVGGQKASVDSVEGRPVVGGQRVSVSGGLPAQVEQENGSGDSIAGDSAASTLTAHTAGESAETGEPAAEPQIQVLTPTPGRAPASKRALLVGINNFPTLSAADTLRGCINDTEDLRASLTQFFGFLPEEIRILCDSQATTKGIKDSLAWLLSDYGGSDVRLFHISSHGTQVADQNNDEYECKDEVIVTYDHSWASPFRDDHLFEIFDQIPQGVNFTFIADSCHSGTIQKGLLDQSIDFKPRYVVPPAAVEDAIFALRQKRDQASQQFISGKIMEDSRGRNLTQEEVMALIGKYQKTFQENTYNNIIATDRHILLAGCEDKQISADARIDGEYRGAFSWAIGKSIRETNGSLTYAELLEQVMGLLRKEFSQIPQLECPADYKNVRLFFPVA